MATDYASGRIYHEETDLSFFITGLGRTVTAMLGTACWGPMNEPTLVTDEDDFLYKFGPPVADSNSYQCARSYFQRGQRLRFIRVSDGAEDSADDTMAVTGAGTAPILRAKYPGTRGNSLTADISAATMDAVNNYKIVLKDNGQVVDIFDEIPRKCDADQNSFVARSDLVYIVNGLGATTTVDLGQTLTLAGGLDGISTIADSDYVGTAGATRTGLQILYSRDAVDCDFIVCPNYADAAHPQALQALVWAEMIAVAEARQDTIAILDPSPSLTVATEGGGNFGVNQFWLGTSAHADAPADKVNTSFAANFWSWITLTDYYNSLADLSLPPGPACAGAISYSDLMAYPWWAPAGINRGSLAPLVKGTAYQPLDSEITTLQSDLTGGVTNPILLIDGSYYIMGQKTMLRSTSALSRINTRRLVNKIRKQAVAAVADLGGDPNDEFSWRQFDARLRPGLEYLKTMRGIQSYDILCELGSTMTADEVAEGKMIGRVILTLMNTAEKVVLGYIITDQGASFTELN